MTTSVGRGLFGMAMGLSCPACAREFSILAGHLASASICCPHCKVAITLSRERRLALWASQLRLAGLSLQAGETDGRPVESRRRPVGP